MSFFAAQLLILFDRQVASEEDLVFAQPAARRWALLLAACRRCPIFLQRLAETVPHDELMQAAAEENGNAEGGNDEGQNDVAGCPAADDDIEIDSEDDEDDDDEE